MHLDGDFVELGLLAPVGLFALAPLLGGQCDLVALQVLEGLGHVLLRRRDAAIELGQRALQLLAPADDAAREAGIGEGADLDLLGDLLLLEPGRLRASRAA